MFAILTDYNVRESTSKSSSLLCYVDQQAHGKSVAQSLKRQSDKMPTTNSATLLNEVTFYQSQQHLLCFEKLHHKHGEAYYLRTLMPMLGHRGFGPQHGNHRTRILSGSLSQNSPTISPSFHHNSGDWFFLPCSYFFLRMWCSTLPAKCRNVPSHKGKFTLPGSPFPFWVSTNSHSHGHGDGTPPGSLTQRLILC